VINPESTKPVEVDERVLQNMRLEEVYIVDYSKLCPNMPRKFYKNMVPDVSITMCENCCKCFLQDEYEFAYIEKGHCPFCKNVEKDKGVKNVYGSLADMSNWTHYKFDSTLSIWTYKIYSLNFINLLKSLIIINEFLLLSTLSLDPFIIFTPGEELE